jgi:putative NADH-flavin reductase
MKILILGATGLIGGELVRQGLLRGYEITALVRSPEKIRARDERLHVVAGSPLNRALLSQTVAGHDAVVSTLGHTDLKPSSIVTDAARALIAVMATSSAKRIVIISSTLVAPGGSFLTKIPRYLTRYAIGDSADMERVVVQADLEWTIVRLVRLTNGGDTPYRLFSDEPPSVTASVSRKTVAAALLKLLPDQSQFQRTIGIASSSQEYPT